MAAETKAPAASALPKAVSFFGAGLMGRPMIERFLNAGYTVCAWNRTVNKLEELASKYPANQLQLFSDPADCFQRNAVSIIMLAEYQPINHVLTSIVAGCPNFKGKTVINTSTISSDESHLLSNKVREAGGIYISAPVLGSVPVAAAGKLAILFSSDDPWQFDKYAEFLSPIGQAKFIGPTGSSATMKLALNQVLAAQVAGYAFSMAFVEKAGLDPKVFQELLQAGPFRSPYFDLKFDNMNNRQFTPVNFPTQLMLKDVDLILAEADKLGLTTSSVDGVKSLLQRTIERGFGRDDFSSVFNGVLPSSESSAGRTPHNYNTHLM